MRLVEAKKGTPRSSWMVSVIVTFYVDDQLNPPSNAILCSIGYGVIMISCVLRWIHWDRLVVDKVQVRNHVATGPVIGDILIRVVILDRSSRIVF